MGAYFQHYGITIIPTVSWSTKDSFDFCFDGIPKGATVDENQNINDIIGREIKLSYQKGDLHKVGVAIKLCSIEYIGAGE